MYSSFFFILFFLKSKIQILVGVFHCIVPWLLISESRDMAFSSNTTYNSEGFWARDLNYLMRDPGMLSSSSLLSECRATDPSEREREMRCLHWTTGQLYVGIIFYMKRPNRNKQTNVCTSLRICQLFERVYLILSNSNCST